jgi:hypothetical protein
MRKIKVLKTQIAAHPDKPKTDTIKYLAGETYEMPEEMAGIFVKEKWGTEVETPANLAKLPVAPPVGSFFKAEPSTIKVGQQSTLKWNCARGAGWSINQDIGGVDRVGEHVVVPAITTVYTLTVIDTDGKKEVAAATVTVLPEKA